MSAAGRAGVPPRSATVIVLGDLARSPRMRRHAECLAAAGFEVDVVGYVDTPLDDWETAPAIRLHPLAPPGGGAGWRAAAARVLRDMSGVAGAAMRGDRGSWVLVQNPPAVHVLPVLRLLCRVRGLRLMVDWHNLGWTMLALRLGARSPLVAALGRLERTAARGADAHLCVSEAMRLRLGELCGIDAVRFRDLPAETFVEAASESDRGELRRELLPELRLEPQVAAEIVDGRAMLLVSSTSWSVDEDFSLLLGALRAWTDAAAAAPSLVVVVSGRGPRRAEYECRLRAAQSAGVHCRTVWLSDAAYARLLAAADLGLCFHRSSSGVDLPMKIADMQGAALPACVLDYGPCLTEVVRDGDNGFLFSDAAGLAALWRRVLVEDRGSLPRMRRRLLDAMSPAGTAGGPPTWQRHWRQCVLPVLGATRSEKSAR